MPRRAPPARTFKLHAWDGDLGIIDPAEGRPTGKTVVVFGKRGMGKSVAMYYLTWKNARYVYTGIAVSNVETSCRDFERCYPGICVFREYTPESVKAVMDLQAQFAADPEWRLDVMNIDLDDVTPDGKAMKHAVILDMFKTGRHRQIVAKIGMQYCIDMPPAARQCSDWIIVSAETNKNVRKKLYTEFLGSVFNTEETDAANYHLFNCAMNDLTQNHQMLALKNQAGHMSIENNLYLFRAARVEDVPRFRVCHKEIWRMDYLFGRRAVRLAAADVARVLMGIRADGAIGLNVRAAEEEEGDDPPTCDGTSAVYVAGGEKRRRRGTPKARCALPVEAPSCVVSMDA